MQKIKVLIIKVMITYVEIFSQHYNKHAETLKFERSNFWGKKEKENVFLLVDKPKRGNSKLVSILLNQCKSDKCWKLNFYQFNPNHMF